MVKYQCRDRPDYSGAHEGMVPAEWKLIYERDLWFVPMQSYQSKLKVDGNEKESFLLYTILTTQMGCKVRQLGLT